MSVCHSLLTAFGWSMLDSIWQMATLWAAYYLITAGDDRFSAAGKHNLALLFVAYGFIWSVYTFFSHISQPAEHLAFGFISVPLATDYWVPYLSGIYMLVLSTRFFQYILRRNAGNNAESACSIPYELQSFIDVHARILGVTKNVQVYLSGRVETAITTGFIRPLILLPLSISCNLSVRQLEAILIHELFHIRRNDYLTNILVSCFRGIFFFNPFARLFYQSIAKQRELACDDGVIETGYEPALYAEALFSLEKFRQIQPGFSLAADGNKPWLLMERVRRVLGQPNIKKDGINRKLVLNFVMAAILFGIQQNSPIAVRPNVAVAVETSPIVKSTVAVKTSPVAPVRYISTDAIVMAQATSPPYKSPKNNTVFNKKSSAPLMLVIVSDTVDKPDVADPVSFAANRMNSQFPEERSADAEKAMMPVMPYSPSDLVTVDGETQIAIDSFRNMDVQENIKDLIANAHIRIEQNIGELKTGIELNKKIIKELEIKNRQFNRANKKDVQARIEKLQKQLKVKKEEIEQMQIQLQVSDPEIIHI